MAYGLCNNPDCPLCSRLHDRSETAEGQEGGAPQQTHESESTTRKSHARFIKARAGFKRTLGKLRWSQISTAFFSLLTTIAIIPYQLGDTSTIIPPKYKAKVLGFCSVCAFLSRMWDGIRNHAIKPPPADQPPPQ